MLRSTKVRLVGLLLLAFVSLGVFWIGPFSSLVTPGRASIARATSPLPFHQYANGPYKVQGNTIVGADGTPYLFHGVGRDSLEFDCSGDGFLDATHLAFMGPGTSGPGGTYWYGNTVRLPVSEGFWLHGFAGQTNCTPTNYQAVVKNTINALTAMKLNVILDLMWTDAGGHATGSGAGYELPDSDSQLFWSQAAKIYASYSNVLFELYNEPHPPTFACWANGCPITNDNTNSAKYSYTGVSIQSLVNAVRGAGANNLALVAGINWGFDLSQLSTYPISGTNIVYDSHPYPYSGKNTTAEWDAAFGYLTGKYPVMSAEFGEYDGQSSFESMAVNYFDAHSMGWTAWAWYSTGGSNAQEIGYPQLVSNYNGTPLANMGTYIYQQLLNYAGVGAGPSPTPTLPPVSGPVSKVWYFAEGRAGAGFKEFLTLGNPSGNDCQTTITYLTQPDRGTGSTKTVSGGADVIGVQHLASDWLFAEGYTGGHFQENFVLANLDPTKKAASVTITLEYTNGSTHAFTVTVNPLSQLI